MGTTLADSPADFTERTNEPVYADEERLPLDWHFIFESDLPPGPRILYAYIVSKSDPDDIDLGVSLAMETMGRDLNVSYATVWHWIQKLQAKGFLYIEQNLAGHNTYFPLHYFAL